MLTRWLAEPHVREWWGNADEELALIETDLDDSPIEIRMVAADGARFAYVQDYSAHHWPMPQYAAFATGARAGALRDRFPAVLVDPDPENTRAVRAYSAAGFAPRFTALCEDGDPVLVMEYDP